MLQYIMQTPVGKIGLHKIAHARLQKLGYADGLTMRNCLHYLGARIFYKNAEYARIAEGMIALHKLLEQR